MSNRHRCPESPSEREGRASRSSLKRRGKGLEQLGECKGRDLSEVCPDPWSTRTAPEEQVLSLETQPPVTQGPGWTLEYNELSYL